MSRQVKVGDLEHFKNMSFLAHSARGALRIFNFFCQSAVLITVALLISITFIYVISKQGWDLEIWMSVCKFTWHLRDYFPENMDASITAHHSTIKYLYMTTNYYLERCIHCKLLMAWTHHLVLGRVEHMTVLQFLYSVSSQQLPSHSPTATILQDFYATLRSFLKEDESWE